MSAPTRIYAVTSKSGEKRLIRAATQAQALRYAASSSFTVAVASQDALVTLLGEGVTIEVPAIETLISEVD